MYIFLSKFTLKSKKLFTYYSITQRMSVNQIFSKVAVCQMTATNNKDNNLEIVKRLVRKSLEYDAKVSV